MRFLEPPAPVDPELQKVIDQAVEEIREAFAMKVWRAPAAVKQEEREE